MSDETEFFDAPAEAVNMEVASFSDEEDDDPAIEVLQGTLAEFEQSVHVNPNELEARLSMQSDDDDDDEFGSAHDDFD